jgi:hypothetical protein
MLRGALAFFWIALAGVSGVYLYSALADPTALGGQLANPLPVGSGETTSAFIGSGSRDRELAEIKGSLRELTQQMAAISAKLNLDMAADSADSGQAAEPETPAASPPEAKPEIAAAPPSPPPPPAPPIEEAKPEPKPVEAPKPEPEPKPIEQAAVETKPTPPAPVEVKPAPKPFEPPAVAVSPIDDLPPEAGSETSSDVPAPPPTPPAAEPAPAPAPASDASASPPAPAAPTPSTTPPATPAPVESAALDPIALPPAANDGSTRYGIEIGTVAKQDGLRPLWREFLTNHAALVAGLQPRRVLAPDKKWRLIAGPFSSADEASQACALFKKASRPCEATVYAGDGL